MKIANILEAEKEAKRFLERLSAARKSSENGHRLLVKGSEVTYTTTSKETGALKRSSMDLTRALSKMRNEIY